MASLFGLPLIFLTGESNMIIIETCIILTKFGVSSAFNLVTIITVDYFPVAYRTSVYGACNVTARVINIFSPMITEVKAPIPMLIYFAMNVGSLLASTMHKKKE